MLCAYGIPVILFLVSKRVESGGSDRTKTYERKKQLLLLPTFSNVELTSIFEGSAA